MPESQSSPPNPHREPSGWGNIIATLDVASMFVVIGAWMGDKLKRHHTVEDVWQETLWQVWRDRDQHEWKGLAGYRAWILSIAKNRIRDVGRSMSRKKRGGEGVAVAFSELATSGTISGLLPHGSTTPSQAMGYREQALVMEQVLAGLDADLESVVRLRLFEELPMKTVAVQLNIPLSTAKARLLRGVRAYRSSLEERLEDGGTSEGFLQS